MLLRADSAYYPHAVVAAARRGGARFSITARMTATVQAAIAGIAADAWTGIRYPRAVWDDESSCWISDAEVAEVPFAAFTGRRQADHVTARLIVRRVKRLNDGHVPAGQGEPFTARSYHAVFTDSPQPLPQAEATHRAHAIVEQVLADLTAGPLAHLPSGRFAANSAWLVLAAIAFHRTRAAGALASTFHARATTATIRAPLLAVPARPARSARRLRLHLPTGWPWQTAWSQLFNATLRPVGSGLTRPPPGRARPETRSGPAGQTGGPATPTTDDQDRVTTRQADQDRRWIEVQPPPG